MLHFKKNHEKSNNANREIANITYLFVALFIFMLGYFMYYIGISSTEAINNTYNSRQELLAKKVIRGKIYARNYEVLAETLVNADQTETRLYPFGNLFAQAVGFSTKGKIGIESLANFNLLTSNAYASERLQDIIEGEKSIGDNVVTTLDVSMQQVTNEALGVYKGAIIIMDPTTGEILAMVSKPDFDPNKINELWEDIYIDTEEGPLLNRTTQGLYPGGSTFKIITLLEYFREQKNEYQDYSFNCTGKFIKGDSVINCYHGISHGNVDLMQSFAKSCNSSFSNISTGLNSNQFRKTCNDLLFNQKLPVSFPYAESFVPISASSSVNEVMQTAIGQGTTQVTPLHMAMITSAIANDGNLMVPYLLQRVENYNKDLVKEYKSKSYGKLMTVKEAELLQLFMEEVVQSGTATILKDSKYTAAGKTGSAEFSSNKTESHAWFTGYACMNEKKIVVTIVLEGAGSGGEYAVPIAKRIFDEYFE